MKFQTPYNYNYQEQQYEKNTLPSETIPDETMTVREIFQRYANGQPLGGNGRTPMSDELKAALPLNWDTMDISERYDFAEKHKLKLTEAQKIMQEHKQEEDEKAYKELIIAEYEASKKTESPNSAASGVPDAG